MNILLSIVFLFLVGCCTPNMADLSKIENKDYLYGKYPKNYKKLIQQYVKSKIFPLGATFEYTIIQPPKKGYTRRAPILGGEPLDFGYYVTVIIKEKTIFPSLINIRLTYLLIKNDSIIDSWTGDIDCFNEPWYSGKGFN